MKKNILITGVAGFIGHKICIELIKKGYKVYGCDDLSKGKKKNVPKKIKFIKIDLSNKKNISKLPKKINYIFHLAGQSSGEKSYEDPMNDLRRNFNSTYNLLNYAKNNKIKFFFYASSMSVYGGINGIVKTNLNVQPISYYGIHKKLSEDYILKFKKDLNFIIFRMFNVYGPGQDLKDDKQGMISIYLSQLLKNNKIIIKGSLDRFRDFIYIDDVVDIWIEGLKNKKMHNKIINVGTGYKTSIKKLIKLLTNLHNSKVRIIERMGTPGDQFGIYSDRSIYKLISKKNLKLIQFGISKFYKWAKKKININ